MLAKWFTHNEVDEFCEAFDKEYHSKLNKINGGDVIAARSDELLASRIEIENLRGKIDGLYEIARKWIFARKYVNTRVPQLEKQIDNELITLQKLCEKYGLI